MIEISDDETVKDTGYLHLTSIEVRNYKSLRSVGPISVQRRQTVLVGENDAGKSSLIRAIGFLLGATSVDDEDHSDWDPDKPPQDPIEVIGIFEKAKCTRSSTNVHVKASKCVSGPRVCEVKVRCHERLLASPSDMSLQALRAAADDLGMSHPGGSKKQPIVDAVDQWIATRPEHEFVDQWMPIDQQLKQRLPRFTEFSSASAGNPEQVIRTIALREARRMLVDEELHHDALKEIGSDIDARMTGRVAYITSKIKEHCPDIDDAMVRTDLDFRQPTLNVEVQLRRNNKDVDLHRTGDGRRRRITLAIHEADHDLLLNESNTRSDFIAYDEPDTHLDFKAQRTLFETLDRQAAIEHVQILTATHSMSFIDKVELQAVVQFELTDRLDTDIRALSHSIVEDELAFISSMCKSVGLRNSALITERCFLVVEGETEFAAMPHLFHAITGTGMASSGVTILNAKGSASMCRLVEALVHQLQRPVVVLVDSDMRTSPSAPFKPQWLSENKFNESSNLFYLGVQEFEDAFSDDTWIDLLNRDFPPRDGGPKWCAKDISSLRCPGKKFSRELVSVVSRRHKRTVGKPELGMAIGGRGLAPEDIPKEIHACVKAIQLTVAS